MYKMRCITAEPFILMYTIVFSMHTATLPQLLLEKSCIRNFNSTVCNKLSEKVYESEQNYAHKESSIWMMILIGAGLLPSAFTVLVLGPFSDKWGRKKTMLIPPVCLTLQSVTYFLNALHMGIHPGFLLFGAIVTAVYGEFQGAVAMAYSYMADVTSKDSSRTMRMAVIEGMVFFAGAPAGLLTGLILNQRKVGFVALFLTTACINLVNFLYVLLAVPPIPSGGRKGSCSSESPIVDKNEQWYGQNSITPDSEKPFDEDFDESSKEVEIGTLPEQQMKDNYDSVSSDTVDDEVIFNPVIHVRDAFSLILQKKLRYTVLPYLLAFCLSVMAFTGELYITVLYIKHQPLNLSAEEVGYYLAAQAAIRGIGVIFISQITIRCCKVADHVLVYIGLLSQCANYILIALSKTKVMLYLVTLTGALMPLATSSLRSIITKQVDPDKHGTVLASIEAMDVIGSIFSNIVVNAVYFDSVATNVGLSFYVLSGFAVLSFLVFGVTFKTRKSKSLCQNSY